MLKWISAVLLAAIALGVWWSRSDPGASGLEGTGPVVKGQVDEDPTVLEGVIEGAALPERQDVSPVGPPIVDSHSPKDIHIDVVLLLGGSAVPGATVFFLDRSMDDGWRASWDSARKRADYLTTHARRLAADANGRLSVPATEDGALLGVASGLLGEVEWIGYPAGVVELKLAMHADLEVDVVDGNGFHVPDVPVALCVNRPGSPTYLVIRKTAARAPARFTNVRRLLLPKGPKGGYAVTLAFPMLERERVPIPKGELPDGPIILTLSDWGTVSVQVTGPNGLPLTSSTLVFLAVQSEALGTSYRAEVSERLANGSVSFPFIGVGTQLAVRVHGAGELRPVELTRPGPSRQGENVAIEVEMVSSFPALVGRLVDPEGAPLMERRGRVTLTSGGGVRAQTLLQSDSTGAFRAVFRDPWDVGQELSANFDVNAVLGAPPLDAVVDVTHALPGGETQLGDVVLDVQPPVATGTVRDGDGNPLIAANIRVEVPRRDSNEWYAPSGLVAPSVADGSFVIYGRTSAVQMRLVVRRAGFATSTTGPLAPGAKGIVVDLVAGQDTAPKPDGLRGSGG